MKRVFLVLLVLGSMISVSQAEMKCQAGKCGAAMKSAAKPKKMMKMFQSVSKGEAILLQKGDTKAFCPECGMTLPMFFKTNHVATVEGKVKQYCSMHCLVDDMQKGSKLTEVKVVDVNSLKFIAAAKAFYVVGSGVKGTMTMVSKYAFSDKEDAEAFAKTNGGKVVDFNTALETAKNDFAKESKMISSKQKMMAQKGEMIYTNKCAKTDKKFTTVAEAKAFITQSNLCKEIHAKQLQAVGLYLKNK